MKTVRVYDNAHVRAALEAAQATGQEITLLSPPAAACLAGIGWWRHLIAQARTDFPAVAFTAVLDCGPATGVAMAAMRDGAGPVAVQADREMMAKLAGIAEQAGTGVEWGGRVALDLLDVPNAALACRQWLGAENPGR